MSQIKKKFILDQAVDETKILLSNQGELKARNAANSADVSLLKLDGSDILKMLKLPRLDSALSAPSDAKDLTPKEYVDQAETDAVTSANAYTDAEVSNLRGDVMLLDGTQAMTAAMSLGGQQIINLADPTVSTDAATKNYVDLEIGAVELDITALENEDLTFLKLDGTRPMTGDLAMGLNKIGGLATPTLADDAATKGYVDTEVSGLAIDVMLLDGTQAMTAAMDLGGFKIENVADPTAAQDAATKAYVDGEIQDKLTDELGVSIATLVAGKVPVSQLPNAIMEYQGTWSAATNTPTLSNTGNAAEALGNVYRVSAAGSVDFGAGSISFAVGDYVILGASGWEKADGTDAVSSVNGQTGIVVLAASDIGVSPAVEGGSDVQSALENLETAIGALESASVEFVQEKFILSAGDITNNYITLANLAIAASINAYVDRLAIHQTDDYTLSTVGGVTRITFAGSLITPGQEKLSANDVIRVKYAKVAI